MLRRELILSGLAVGALGAAEGLRPRNRLKLLRNTTIDSILPKAFTGWDSNSVDDLVGPQQAGRLARSLYSEIVARVYFEAATGAGIMLLAAYGDTQSDLLQLHRPESCYPAVGFTLKMARSIELPIRPGVLLPARRVIAATSERTESIVYWTRMGEALPRTAGEQRMARLENAVHGDIPDGILVRCSAVGDPDAAFPMVDRFVVGLLQAIGKPGLPALVGTQLAQRLA